MDLMFLITFQPVKVKQKEKLYLLLMVDKLVTESEKTMHMCSLAYIIKCINITTVHSEKNGAI